MKRQIPGLHRNQRGVESKLEGLFLVRVDRACYRWHPQRPFVEFQFFVLEPKAFEARSFPGRLYCTEKALWRLNWFLRDFGYDAQLLKDDRVDEKALLHLRGVVRTSYTTLNGRSYQNLEAFAPEADWEALDCTSLIQSGRGEAEMVYSFSQISQYLRCPRSYRYRYLDGWQEQETRAAMVFGRCFENALGAYFRKEDCGAALFTEWEAYRDAAFEYKKGETWDRLLHQGIHLLETFARQDRVRIHDPHNDLQTKKFRALGAGNEFVAYLDAIGDVDGVRCLIDWKTTTSRYPDAPEGLLSLEILSLSVIRGSVGSPKQPWLFLCGSMLPKSSI